MVVSWLPHASLPSIDGFVGSWHIAALGQCDGMSATGES